MRPSEILKNNQEQIRLIFKKYPLINNPKIFGSVARGEDTEGSDIDFLIQTQQGVTFIMLGSLKSELKLIFSNDIDIVTENQLPAHIKKEVLAEAVAL